jgi:transposase
MGRRKRRHFTDKFKADTVRLVHDGGLSIARVAKDLDLTESALREWVAKAEAKRRGEDVLAAGERDELRRLRRENKVLRTERDILKKPQPSSRGKAAEVCFHPRGEGDLSHFDHVQGPSGLPQRLSRLAGLAVPGGGHRPVLPQCGGLEHGGSHANRVRAQRLPLRGGQAACDQRAAAGGETSWSRTGPTWPIANSSETLQRFGRAYVPRARQADRAAHDERAPRYFTLLQRISAPPPMEW